VLFLDLNSNISLDFSPWIVESGQFTFDKVSVGKKSFTKVSPGEWKVDGSWPVQKVTIKGDTSVSPQPFGTLMTTIKRNKVTSLASSISLTDSEVVKANPVGLLSGMINGKSASYDWEVGPLAIEGNVFYVTPSKIVVHLQSQGTEISVGVLEISENKVVWTPNRGDAEVFEKTAQSITKNGQPFITWE
jgi:hypothetical protein